MEQLLTLIHDAGTHEHKKKRDGYVPRNALHSSGQISLCRNVTVPGGLTLSGAKHALSYTLRSQARSLLHSQEESTLSLTLHVTSASGKVASKTWYSRTNPLSHLILQDR